MGTANWEALAQQLGCEFDPGPNAFLKNRIALELSRAYDRREFIELFQVLRAAEGLPGRLFFQGMLRGEFRSGIAYIFHIPRGGVGARQFVDLALTSGVDLGLELCVTKADWYDRFFPRARFQMLAHRSGRGLKYRATDPDAAMAYLTAERCELLQGLARTATSIHLNDRGLGLRVRGRLPSYQEALHWLERMQAVLSARSDRFGA